MDIISQPWPWFIAGPAISLIMLLLLYFGGNFGVSANLRTICSIGGAGKYSDFFRINWRSQTWNLIFVIGAILGGFLASVSLSPSKPVALNPKTVVALNTMGFDYSTDESYLPDEIFGRSATQSTKGVLILVIGGLFVGFGARYAGGCTSGHAISGLSDLQIPSLVAVVGFFLGGLIMTHFFLPIIFS